MDNPTKDYKLQVSEKLSKLTPIFAKASIGDFSEDIEIPDEDDEFTQLYVGIQIMLEVIREQLAVSTINQQSLQVAKEKTESEKALYEAMLESMGDGAIVTDTNGQITHVNYHAQMLLGFRPSELVGRDYFEAIAAFDDTGHPIEINRRIESIALREGRKSTGSLNFIKQDKQAVPVAVTASPIILSGRTVGCIAVFRDITREKQIDEMKNEFLSFAAHQLRTPLSTMRWNMELVMRNDGTVPPKIKDKINSMYSANKKMISLVNDLLNVSRIDSGRVVHKIEAVNIVEAIKEAINDIRVLSDEKMVKVSTQFPAQQVYISADPQKLREVLQNILTNSLKFNSPLGKINIEMKASVDNVLVMVSDSGMGIPPRDAPRIFEKFYRASNAVLGQTPGSGLGLFLVKSYLEAWKGRVWFESPAKKEFRETLSNQDTPGTTFYLEFLPKEVTDK